MKKRPRFHTSLVNSNKKLKKTKNGKKKVTKPKQLDVPIDEVDSNDGSIGDIEDAEAYEGKEKSDSGYENKINEEISFDPTSTTSTERNNFQMVGNNVVYEEGRGHKLSRDILKGNLDQMINSFSKLIKEIG